MNSYWIRVGPSPMTCVIIRRIFEHRRNRETGEGDLIKIVLNMEIILWGTSNETILGLSSMNIGCLSIYLELYEFQQCLWFSEYKF